MAHLEGQLLLPEGWEVSQDSEGNVFYIDHINRVTQWEAPPLPCTTQSGTGAGRNGAEIVNFSDETAEMRDLKTAQAKMILKYLLAVQENFKSKNEITDTLRKRLELAGAESSSLKQLLSSCVPSASAGQSATGVLNAGKAGQTKGDVTNVFDVSFLTKQYMDSQKRLQILKEELAMRTIHGDLSFSQSIRHLLNHETLPSTTYPIESITDVDSPATSNSWKLEHRLRELSRCIEEIRVKLAPLQDHFDHDRLSVIQEKEHLLNEMVQCQRNLQAASALTPAPNAQLQGQGQGSLTSSASALHLGNSINSLKAEIAREKQICNLVMNQRLSLLQQKHKLEEECTELVEKLKSIKILSSSQDIKAPVSPTHFSTPSTARVPVNSLFHSTGINIQPSNFHIGFNASSRVPVFLSDVSPEIEDPDTFFGPRQAEITRSFSTRHIKNISSASESSSLVGAGVPRSQSFKSNMSAVLHNSQSVNQESPSGMYENLAKIASPENFKPLRASEEHNSKESHYESLYDDSIDVGVYHDRDDSGVAFYENISSSAPGKEIVPPRTHHKKSSSIESMSNPGYFSSLKCKILIDIKFTVDHQLHVRLEELKDLTMLQALAGLQFSVELYSLDDPNFSLCQCSPFVATNDFEKGGNLIVNEFMAFDLPYNGQIDSCFVRFIMFCRPRSNSQNLPENFLAELNLSLASVFRSQQISSRLGSTSSWYQLSMNETCKIDCNSLKLHPTVHQQPHLYPTPPPMYDPVYVPTDRQEQVGLPPYLQDEPRSHASAHSSLSARNYPMGYYSVKNAIVAKLQPLSESQTSISNWVGVNPTCSRDALVTTSDEGYDERAVDSESVCSNYSNNCSPCTQQQQTPFRRSATFCQATPNQPNRAYSSFTSSHTPNMTESTHHILCKLNRSESDSATQHYLVRPSHTHRSPCPSPVDQASSFRQPSLGSRFKRNAVERIPSRVKQKIAPVKYANTSSRFSSASPVGARNISSPSQSNVQGSVAPNVPASLRRKVNHPNNGSE